MRRIEIPITTNRIKILLGRVSENLVTQVVFDCGAWVELYGQGDAELIHKRSGDSIGYRCLQTTQEDEILTWTVTNDDTGYRGLGQLQVRWYVDDALKQSAVYTTETLPSLTASEDEPTEVKSALDLLLQAVEDIDVEQAISDYLDDHPIEVPVTSVNEQIGDVVITAQSLGALTEHQSLAGYATESWVGQQGFLTSYTETDPTVPAWAKASSKPSYTASEVGALPSTTVIPSKTSDLTNDSGFVTQEDVKEQILSDDYTEEKVPYLYREAPYSVASVEEKIVGGTVGWNQLEQFNRVSGSQSGVTYANNNDGTFTLNGTATENNAIFPSNIGTSTPVINGHKYLAFSNISSPSTSSIAIGVYVGVSSKLMTGTSHLIYAPTSESGNVQIGFRVASGMSLSNMKVTGGITDLTTMLGSTIADYIYSLERATAGAGVAKLKEWGFFTEDYYEYCEPTLKSVEGLQSKVTRDVDDNIIATYPFDSTLTLRGIPKLDSSNNLYYDGDTYESDGTVSRRFAERAYQSGDESLADAITDGTTTVVKLATPTTETAVPYHNPQIVGDTEEFVTTGIIPVGHETKCYAGTMNLINSKADKATTYTKTEVDTALSAKAGTAVATTSANGLMSSTDKSRLDDLYADYSSALTALGVN